MDYHKVLQNITFTSGQGVGSQVNISITIINDNIAESDESFYGNLSLDYLFGTITPFPISQSVSVDPKETEIVILDDDSKILF